jgi:TetR/AcrR family transcriptional regulator
MGTSERREREKEQRRAVIITAAEELFFTKGISNTTMDEIADKVELSKGAVYLYFKSKEELFAAIVQRGLAILHNLFAAAAKRNGNGLERLRAIGDEFYRFHREYPNYFSAIFYHEFHAAIHDGDESLSSELLKDGEEMMELTARVIQEGIADGSIRPGIDPQTTSLILDGFLTGIIRMVSAEKDHLLKCHQVDGEELIRVAMNMIFYALKGPALEDKK